MKGVTKHMCKPAMAFCLSTVLALPTAVAQLGSRAELPLSFEHYLAEVATGNCAYAAERYAIPIAEAELASAGAFPDPELSFAWFDNGERRLAMGYGFSTGLSWTLELGGKRSARRDLAQAALALDELLLQEYFHQLRAEATAYYLKALHLQALLDVKEEHLQALTRHVPSEEPDSTSTAELQAALRLSSLRQEVSAQRLEYHAALSGMHLLMSRSMRDTVLLPVGELSTDGLMLDSTGIAEIALAQRADVVAARQRVDLTERERELARANRVADLGLHAAYTYASYTRNIIAPTPSFAQTLAGISIPIKFSNNREASLARAELSIRQAELRHRQAELQVLSEVEEAWYRYEQALLQWKSFDADLLSEARTLVNDSQLTADTTHSPAHLEALELYTEARLRSAALQYELALSVVALQRACGVWDVGFM